MTNIGVIDNVDQRTQLVGRNRLELLLFRLGTKQRFAINVFKVREVIRCPPLTRVPHAHYTVRGVATMRGATITVLDLAAAIGSGSLPPSDQCFVAVTEFNRQVQGFLVSSVDRIININWEAVRPPPRGTGRANYVTAVTEVDGELVEIIDVERVLAEFRGVRPDLPDELAGEASHMETSELQVFVVDDSGVARKQISRTLQQIGINCELAENGKEALDRLRALADDGGPPVPDRFVMVISDVEMPSMDGYTLTKEIKADKRLCDLHVLLHSSLSGMFNQNMIRKVGADEFLPKFSSEELGRCVLERVRTLDARHSVAA